MRVLGRLTIFSRKPPRFRELSLGAFQKPDAIPKGIDISSQTIGARFVESQWDSISSQSSGWFRVEEKCEETRYLGNSLSALPRL